MIDQKETQMEETLSYAEYRQTPEWLATREKALKSVEYQCQLCHDGDDKVALDAYHLEVKKGGRKQPGDIVVLCDGCYLYNRKKLLSPEEQSSFGMGLKLAVFGPSAVIGLLVPALMHMPLPAEIGGLVAAAVLAVNSPYIFSWMKDSLPEPLAERIEGMHERKQARLKAGEFNGVDRLLGRHMRAQSKQTSDGQEPHTEPLSTASAAYFQAVPENKLLRLERAHGTETRFDPPMNALLGRGGLLTGAPGSGKSNIIELLMMSASACQMSALLIDFKREFYPLLDVLDNPVRAGHPDYESQAAPGYNGVTAENAASFAADMMEFGFQMIFDVQSYRDQDELAETLAALLDGLMEWSQQVHDEGETPPPCLVITDEAHNFVPEQRTKSAFSMEEASFRLLKKAYSWIGTAGRSYGYTVIHATQRIANIATWAIAGLQIKVVMCHTEENDLNRCEKEIGKQTVKRGALKQLQPGQGYVLGFTPDPVLVQFDQCPARHVSVTPTVEHAHARQKKRLLADRQSQNDHYQHMHQQRKAQRQHTLSNSRIRPTQNGTEQPKSGRYGRNVTATQSPSIERERGEVTPVSYGRNFEVTPALGEGVSGQMNAVTGVSDWDQQKVELLIGFYRVFGNLDDTLKALQLSTSQKNREMARAILKQQGIWKEGK